MSTPLAVPFVDFKAHVSAHRRELDTAVARVLDSGWFILGPEGEAFERELAAALGSRDAVAVANGTDALHLALRALGVGAGDEVVTAAAKIMDWPSATVTAPPAWLASLPVSKVTVRVPTVAV